MIAFQPDAFQDDAFQTQSGAPVAGPVFNLSYHLRDRQAHAYALNAALRIKDSPTHPCIAHTRIRQVGPTNPSWRLRLRKIWNLPYKIYIKLRERLHNSQQVKFKFLSSDFLANMSEKWRPVVLVDGVDISSQLVGQIRIEAEEGMARLADFQIVPPINQAIQPQTWIGKKVQIFYADQNTDGTPKNAILRYTGLIDTPRYDPCSRTLDLSCTDDLQQIINQASRDTLRAMCGLIESKAVYDDNALNWLWLSDRIKQQPASVDLDTDRSIRFTQWAAKSTPDITYTASRIIDEKLSITLAQRVQLKNDIDIICNHRRYNLKARAYRGELSFSDKVNVCSIAAQTAPEAAHPGGAQATESHTTLTGSFIRFNNAADQSAPMTAKMGNTTLAQGTDYSRSASGIQLIGNSPAFAGKTQLTITLTYKRTDTSPNAQQADWYLPKERILEGLRNLGCLVPFTPSYEPIPPVGLYTCAGGSHVAVIGDQAVRDQLTAGFAASVVQGYAQRIVDQKIARVYLPASIEKIGRLYERREVSIDDEFDASTWEQFFNRDGPQSKTAGVSSEMASWPTLANFPSLNFSGGEACIEYYASTDTDRLAADTALQCLIAEAKTTIKQTHRLNTLAASVAFDPRLDTTLTLKIENCRGLDAQGKVRKLTEIFDIDSGAATSDFELAISSIAGSGISHPEYDARQRATHRLVFTMTTKEEAQEMANPYKMTATYDYAVNGTHALNLKIPKIEPSSRKEQIIISELDLPTAIPEDMLISIAQD